MPRTDWEFFLFLLAKEYDVFEYEAQTLGRLRHDNIAQIYEAGTHDGSVDLLVTGCEVSLWMGEQFAADLHRAFPKLCIVAISANKLQILY